MLYLIFVPSLRNLKSMLRDAKVQVAKEQQLKRVFEGHGRGMWWARVGPGVVASTREAKRPRHTKVSVQQLGASPTDRPREIALPNFDDEGCTNDSARIILPALHSVPDVVITDEDLEEFSGASGLPQTVPPSSAHTCDGSNRCPVVEDRENIHVV